MQVDYDHFQQLKKFVSFEANDIDNLRSLAPLLAEVGPTLTDDFYALLGSHPGAAAVIEGRVDQLKQTHAKWLRELTGGDYGDAYFASRVRIGRVHVMQDIEPTWVEAVMSVIRTRMLQEMGKRIKDAQELAAKSASFIKICDLDALVINMAYADERLERLTSFTGMKRALVENIIRIPPAAQPVGESN